MLYIKKYKENSKLLRSILFTILFLVLLSFSSEALANNSKDTTVQVICNVIFFVQKLGLPIMTGIIIGSAVMAIFGRLAWPAIVMLVVFTAIFFGAGQIITKFVEGAGTKDAQYNCDTYK